MPHTSCHFLTFSFFLPTASFLFAFSLPAHPITLSFYPSPHPLNPAHSWIVCGSWGLSVATRGHLSWPALPSLPSHQPCPSFLDSVPPDCPPTTFSRTHSSLLCPIGGRRLISIVSSHKGLLGFCSIHRRMPDRDAIVVNPSGPARVDQARGLHWTVLLPLAP